MKTIDVEINERTRVPLGVATIAVIFFAGLVAWAVRVESAASATAANTMELKTKQERYAEDISVVKSDLRLIKQKLGVEE